MVVVRWKDPFSELTKVHETMNRLFEDAFPAQGAREGASPGSWKPAVDIFETDDAIVLSVEVPGVDREHIFIELKDGVLSLSGERKLEKEAGEERYHRMERCYGAFHRFFTLPAAVDPGKVDAALRDGVLRIRLPKREEAKPRQIAVH